MNNKTEMPGTVDKTEKEYTEFSKDRRNAGDDASESKKDGINMPKVIAT